MYIDLQRETRIAWSVLGGTFLVGLIVLLVLADTGELKDQVEQESLEQKKLSGNELIATRIEAQRIANQRLAETINGNSGLKAQVKYRKDETYEIPADDKEMQAQHGAWFLRTFNKAALPLYRRAQELGIGEYEKVLGFPAGKLDKAQVDPELAHTDNDRADYLLIMLDITEKVAWLAMATETPLQKLLISHGDNPIESGPEGRPPLLIEYPFTLKVRGTHKDVLWLMRELSVSVVDRKVVPYSNYTRKYPIIVRGFDETSLETVGKNTGKLLDAHDDITPIDVEIELAALDFPDTQNGASSAPATGQREQRLNRTTQPAAGHRPAARE
jgi:hypothetical protein